GTLPLCDVVALPLLCATKTTSGGTTSTNPLDQLTKNLPKLRGAPEQTARVSYADLMRSYDPDLVALLVPGVAR
ncbi:hypothetical protein, partial [Nocardioides sp.]|uniref:hypothetical protein n=1 Tax=Nocardioides sp. TaxID=35761 RepID=UPI002CBC3F1A